MKNILLTIFAIGLFIVAIFTTVNLFQSAWYVFTLEQMSTLAAGYLFGKLLFLLIVLLGIYYLLKSLRKSKS
ncbi:MULTISPECIES: hypothetical protein [Enterobacter cloacae complex]|uniref:hypothetical protein n=1 Tax=Enterobacter cloacae complex TaxID=354276 RepID=UPI00088D06C3|nr:MULTISPECIES: hypothetical protein [Enterobacter cloacae complex]HCJ7375919.1 hypothetical protein [Enterobacter hormaechei subsp. xiangfangensis]EKS6647708.1 hypothetical protein [Enterobacter hormaechei]MBN4832363.1 hypothetical protein [Enterobacter hormaechei]WNJ33190.1 hypothetical protein RMN59_12715 [Enterobacter hormaechei subsp. hormaechei]SCZ23532.1 hypothetical protein SAMN03159368_1031 [Enterobacter hormaechei]